MVKKKKISLLIQVAILFLVGFILVDLLLSRSMTLFSYAVVMSEQTDRAEAEAKDLTGYLNRYPARDWLLQYWYEHYDEMDIEYDAADSADSETARKLSLLSERHPGFSPDYAGEKDVEALPREDQKLYAEIVYSRLISRIDRMQQAHGLSYVFGVVTEEPYDDLFLLFISAKPGAARGDGAGEVYPIGTELPVTADRRDAVRSAVAGAPTYAYNEDGKYFDYYYSVGSVGGREVLIGITRNISGIRETVGVQTTVLKTLSIIFLVLMAVLFLLMIFFAVLRPLKKVQKSISLYKDTKDSRAVTDALSKVRTHNEIAELSGDVAAMAEELNAYMIRTEQTAVREEHIKTELDLAGRIQASMLPSVFPPYPGRKDFEIYASMTPAKVVGGDFYEFSLPDEDHLCLMIADVSGKGVPAALFMMASKILLEHNVKMGKSAAQVLSDVNTAICNKNAEEMFVTVWLGILDLRTGQMQCANAGHEYPMLKQPGGRYELIKDRHDLVLGAMKGLPYHEYELRLERGASLFLYTDGLAEAVDPENRMFGTERILEELNKDPDRSPEETLRGMKEAVDAYVQGLEPFDDLTMLGLTYHGPASP